MTMATDPWQPVGTLIYHIVQFVANATGYAPLTGDGLMPREYEEDPEPRWMHCGSCNRETTHEPHFWIEDGEADYECTRCGAVRYE